ncbi:MAG: hypothetical protein WBC92_19120 [Terracidiphilus sp.]
MNELPDAIDRLVERVEGLERRVDALEHPLAARWPHTAPEAGAAPIAAALPIAPAGSLFPVLGRALLGIAGAYLLRAVEEASSLPKLVVAFAGIAYAFVWLVWAARTRGGTRFTCTIYACTSALILAPMLWELTLRFRILPAAIAAGVLCAFALAAIGLAWKRDLKPVLRVACTVAAGLALGLAIASHEMMPFIVALLMVTAACEFAPEFDCVPEVGALVALIADAAIWILIFVYFSPQNAHEDYPALGRAALLAPGVAMFVLFTASVIAKTVLCGQKIGIFETVQTTIAFLLAAVSLADFGPANSTIILGAVCLVLSAASYAATFMVFARREERRNAAVFAAWSAALWLAGSWLCLPPLAMIVSLGAGAVAATFVGRRRSWPAFEFYGMIFLAAAAAASGLLSFLVGVLIGTPPGLPALSIWLAAVCAILCYAAAEPREGDGWAAQALHLGFAALAAGSVVALLVQGLVALIALKVIPGAHHLAFVRTLTLCAAALALVFSGARWRRLELTRLGYAALALVAVKLVVEDLRHGHLAYIAGSIFLVALTLIAAPRVARVRQKA